MQHPKMGTRTNISAANKQMLISKLILEVVSCWLDLCAAEGCCLAPVPLASHPAHTGTGRTAAEEDGTNGSSRGQEHVHLQASQLALVKPVLKALPERCPSFCCLGEFYTSESGFIMMPEHQKEMSEITHRMAQTALTPQKFPELKIVSEDIASGHSGCISVFFQKSI